MRVLVCDDQALIRDGLSLLLGLEQDIVVVGAASDGAEALDLVSELTPDVVLMDLKMPVMNGIEATRRIRRDNPMTRVLVLTTYDDDEWLFDAIRAGASGYLLKDAAREDVIQAVRGTAAGRSHIDPAVAGRLLHRVAADDHQPPTAVTRDLTDREVDVLRLLALGLTNAEIAGRLYLSEGTVRNHTSSILAKLGLADRTQAAVLAIQHGLDREQA